METKMDSKKEKINEKIKTTTKLVAQTNAIVRIYNSDTFGSITVISPSIDSNLDGPITIHPSKNFLQFLNEERFQQWLNEWDKDGRPDDDKYQKEVDDFLKVSKGE